jgi:hypothetical protein
VTNVDRVSAIVAEAARAKASHRLVRVGPDELA